MSVSLDPEGYAKAFREHFALLDAADAAPTFVDHALKRAELVRRLCAARRTERALRDELLEAEMKVGYAALALSEFDDKGRAPS